MGLIKRNNSKNWYVQFVYEGKTYIKSTKTTNKREAAKVEHKMRAEIFKTDVLGEADSISIKDAIDLLMETFIDRPVTYKKKKYLKKFLNDNLDTERMMETLSSRDVENLKRIRMRRGNKNSTINHTIIFIRMVHKNAKRLGYKVQSIEFPVVRPDKHKIRYLSLEEEKLLLKELQPTNEKQLKPQQDNYDFVIALLDTGARHGEIACLKWENVDLEARTIQLFRPKVRNQSVLYMSDRLYSVLNRRKQSKINSYVFNAKDGGHRKHNPIAINKAIKRAKLDGVSIHTFRHTFASRMAQNGMNIQEIQILLGHTDISTTLRYTHLLQTDVSIKAADIINNLNKAPILHVV